MCGSYSNRTGGSTSQKSKWASKAIREKAKKLQLLKFRSNKCTQPIWTPIGLDFRPITQDRSKTNPKLYHTSITLWHYNTTLIRNNTTEVKILVDIIDISFSNSTDVILVLSCLHPFPQTLFHTLLYWSMDQYNNNIFSRQKFWKNNLWTKNKGEKGVKI